MWSHFIFTAYKHENCYILQNSMKYVLLLVIFAAKSIYQNGFVSFSRTFEIKRDSHRNTSNRAKFYLPDFLNYLRCFLVTGKCLEIINVICNLVMNCNS